ncbi:MAG: hypothetical protein KBS84_00005 [Treponema sp.]|nr:hypothetical protein [Candidatus Treponema scatequi]
MSDYENEKESDSNFESFKIGTEPLKYPGFKSAVKMLLVAAAFLAINFLTINYGNSYYPKIFLVGFVILGFAIGDFVAPGKRVIYIPSGSTSKERTDYAMKASGASGWIIHILFAVVCCVAGIYILIKEEFEKSLPLCFAVILIGAVIIFIKEIIIWIIDCSKTIEEKEEMEKDGTKYQSLRYRVLSIVISFVIAASCSLYFYCMRYSLMYDFGVKSPEHTVQLHHEKWADEYLKGDLQMDVPFRIMGASDNENVDFMIDADEINTEDNEYKSVLTLPLSQILSYVMIEDSHCKLAFCADKAYSEYDKHSLEKIKNVKKFFEEHQFDSEKVKADYSALCSMLKLLNKSEEDFESVVDGEVPVFLDAKYTWVVSNHPHYDNEFICMWDVPSFVEYYNNMYGTSYEAEELIDKVDNQELGYDVFCSGLGTALYYFYNQRHFNCGLIINFGAEGMESYSSLAADKIMSKLCEDEEYMKLVNSYLESQN